MKKVILLLLMTISLIAGTCTDDQFSAILSDKTNKMSSIIMLDRKIISIDTSSMKNTDHGYSVSITMIDLDSDYYLKSNVEFDRNLNHTRLLSIYEFNCSGKNSNSSNKVNPWESVGSNTMFYAVGKFVKHNTGSNR